MNDRVVDPTNDAGDLEGLERDLTEAVTAAKAPEEEAPAAEETTEASSIPEKYRGKTLEDVIDMHQNLQSEYGRMANDLGTQRKLTDRLLDLKRTEDLQDNTPADEPLPEISSTDLLDDPSKTLDSYLSRREERLSKTYEQRMAELEGQLAQERFLAKHPEAATLGENEDFQNWLSQSPIRQQAAQQAASGDWTMADALLNEFKSNSASATAEAPKADLEEARKASLTSSGTGNTAGGSEGKIYRRADLIRLKLEKPHVYEDPAFQAEIMRAYQEKRVK